MLSSPDGRDTDSKPQPLNPLDPMERSPRGKDIPSKAEQPENAPDPMLVTALGMSICLRAVQLLNMPSPIAVIHEGRSTFVSDLQEPKRPEPRLVTVSGIAKDSIPDMEKAYDPMLLTFEGMLTDFRDGQE